MVTFDLNYPQNVYIHVDMEELSLTFIPMDQAKWM